MNIGVFAYDFEHWKAQQGMQNLILNGRKPSVIFAAPRVKLNFYRSKIRTSPKDLFLYHPKEIADHYDIDYHVLAHNTQETSDLVKQYDLDLGIILGARILRPIVIDQFKIGVLNMHPGILPENRGLDTIKWAIINDLPQGVTTHLIDSNIDRGCLIQKQTINVYDDDTLLDLRIRLQHLEQKMMLDAITLVQNKDISSLKRIGKGSYNKSMPLKVENSLLGKFVNYKNKRCLK
jgi:phosphoribosylglycinamide formyltransferase-1